MTAPATNILNQLRDIHAPAPIAWWPPAVGWFVLAGLVFIALIALLIWWIKIYPKRLLRKAALKELYALSEKPPSAQLAELSKLLKRVVKVKFAKTGAVSKTNTVWLEFLDKTGNTKEFTRGVGKVLAQAPYIKQDNPLDPQLMLLVKKWILLNTKT